MSTPPTPISIPTPKILFQQEKKEDTNLDFDSFLNKKLSKANAESFGWEKICIKADKEIEESWVTVMNKYRDVGPDSSLHLSEGAIRDFFVKEKYDPQVCNIAAQNISRILAFRKQYLDAQNEAKHKQEKEQQQQNRRIHNYDDKPHIRLGSLIPDLYFFELYLINHNVLQKDILQLLAQCVDRERGVIISNRINDPFLNNKSWNESKLEILMSLDPSKTMEHHRRELRQIAPMKGESTAKYHRRFFAYVSILNIETYEAAEIFILSLPEYVQRHLRIETAPRNGMPPKRMTITEMMDFLCYFMSPIEKTTYLKSEYNPREEKNKLGKDYRNERLGKQAHQLKNKFHIIKKKNKQYNDAHKPNNKTDGDNKKATNKEDLHCWKCNEKGDHLQPGCPKSGPGIYDYAFAPAHVKERYRNKKKNDYSFILIPVIQLLLGKKC